VFHQSALFCRPRQKLAASPHFFAGFFLPPSAADTGYATTIVLDPKGELFEQTASDYRDMYRLDLIDPTRSDYWNFLRDCKGNAQTS
jgi:hypothetical protein